MKIIDELFSYAKTEDDLPALFAHMITDRVYEYEQKYLSEIAPQNVISEILNEKRKMTVEQMVLLIFFGVPETTFLG